MSIESDVKNYVLKNQIREMKSPDLLLESI
jgi:hypothetical protein